MNGLRLCVHMRKEETKEGALQTMPSRVFQGIAEFEETLFMKCTLYGSKGSSNRMKFMSKVFIVSVIAPDAEELDFGKHQLDLAHLLAEDRKGILEKVKSWDVVLDLSGKAKGGKLIITFGYEVVDKDSSGFGIPSSRLQGSPSHRSSVHTSYSLPNSAHGTPRTMHATAHNNYSPAVSDPGNDYNDLEHFNLDEPFPKEGANDVKGQQDVEPKVKSGSQVDEGLAPPMLKKVVKNGDIDRNTENDDLDTEEDDTSSKGEGEFVVVDQGMEFDDSVMNDGELGEHAVVNDSDDLNPKIFEAIEKEQEAGREIHVKSMQDATYTAEGLESSLAERELYKDHKERSGNSQQRDKKETVTYQMVMQTLDSLLQGTSAKERAQEEILEEISDFTKKPAHGTAKSHMMNTAYTRGMNKKPDTIGTKDVRGMVEVAKDKGLLDNLDTEADLVAGEFLHMLELGDPMGQDSDTETDSPRARLLKQFEQETLLEGAFGLDANLPEVPELMLDGAPNLTTNFTSSRADAVFAKGKSLNWDNKDEKELTSILEAAESELQQATRGIQSRTHASMLEHAETGGRIYERRLAEKDFAISPPKHTFKQQEPLPLGKGLGAAIGVKDGGSLRSMNPFHFQKCSGKLVMQVSKPVVVPAEMGSGIVDILRNMASMGIENMALQAMTAMPLEDLSGKSVEQIAMEGMAAHKSFRNRHVLEASWIKPPTKGTSWKDAKIGPPSNDNNEEYVSLGGLAPMAMQQIEFLAIHGLIIESDMTEEHAPYTLNVFTVEGHVGQEDISRPRNVGALKGVTGVHLLKGAKVPAETSGCGNLLMDMAISLDEWMLLDAGLYDEKETSKKSSAIVAAHYAVHQNRIKGGDKQGEDRDGRKGQLSTNNGARWGCMGNTVTITMLVQLRDPLRNNEAVGAPMLTFIQAERVVFPSKSKVGQTGSIKGNNENEGEPQFKITGVHMAGLKAPQDAKKPGWGSWEQQHTGSRWLISHGMAKSNKSDPMLKSKSTTVPTPGKGKVKQGETLWSISAQVHGSGNKWKNIMKLNSHIRNPDVIYENQITRTK